MAVEVENGMVNSKALRTRHLVLDDLVPNVDLARRLPHNLARQFHALPLAEERGLLTVVMADPDDMAACQAVTRALGTAPYIVRGDRAVIDTWIAQLWAQRPTVRPQYLVYAPQGRNAGEWYAYACQLGNLTGAEVGCLDQPDVAAVAKVLKATPCDLVVCGQACECLARRVLCGPADSRLAECVSTSLLVLAGVRWPLRKILLAILDPASNEASLAWVRTLAQPSGGAVTALAVVPPIPDLYGNLRGMKHDIGQLLATGTPLGREMRRVAQLLVDWRIDGVLRLRQGPISREIRLEAQEGDYDLIVLCAETQDRLMSLVLGGLVNPLLRWADRPVLIAKTSPTR
jgi:nucleotide-binding universal stress UspA family protein